MALTRTAAQLVADVRNRADHLVGSFRDDATLRRYLSESCRSLVSWLVDEYDEMYWARSTTVTTTANVQTSVQPTDLWKTVTMRVTLDSYRDRIGKADMDDVDVEGVNQNGWSGGLFPKHRMVGRTIYWVPTPRAAHTVTLFYVPTGIFFASGGAAISEFAAGTDYFDGVFGWEHWVVLDSAIKLLNDEKKDPVPLLAELQRREAEIRTAAANQVTDEAPKVRDRWRSDFRRMPPGGWDG